ncbi:hypothetical protein B1R32_108118 [Abditibacterium utsteinense]|uniref:Uncharacterized protein n=1 Tax=Abditibacterium utsteinense TaxID=1960156 RepID=A0A2S8SSY8_9BACT|nr:hypothetical protein B1R32_108118 [Abditibacterium utsteinense]
MCFILDLLFNLLIVFWPCSSKSRLEDNAESRREYEFWLQERRAARKR